MLQTLCKVATRKKQTTLVEGDLQWGGAYESNWAFAASRDAIR